MSTAQAFKEQILKVRREVQLSCDSKSLLHALQESKRCLNGLAANDPKNHTICAAHLAKELLDWMAVKEDHEVETVAAKDCIVLLDDLLTVCHQGEKTSRHYLVTRLYNAIVAVNSKPSRRRIKLMLARLLSRIPIGGEKQAELFDRVKFVVLKIVQEAKVSSAALVPALIEEGVDLVIEMQRKLLVHAAGTERNSDGVRQLALTLFREVFDNGMAVLCRLYSISAKKAQQLYETITDTMRTVVRPDETELISLLGDGLGFLETILGYAGGEHPDYCQFAQFITMFEGIKSEPYASCYRVVCSLVQLIRQDNPTHRQIDRITERVRALHDGYATTLSLAVRVAIFLTCQAVPYLYRLPQEAVHKVSDAAIGLSEALMLFVRHCPKESVQALCRKCTGSRRHLADKLLSMLLQLHMVQAKAGTMAHPVKRVSELIKRKLELLEQLDCERKQMLIDSTMRQSISWLKHVLTLLRANANELEGNVADIVLVLKLLIVVQSRYRFDYLPDLHLVRMLENSYVDQTTAIGVTSCWPAVSVRMLKLLLTIREQPKETGEEQQAASISSIVRSIMCYQINAPETDHIRNLTIVQLYEQQSFDTHSFTFDCAPSLSEKFTILAEEMALAAKYQTSNTLPVWEYLIELAKFGDIRTNCLTFGMALHGFSENDAEKLPPPMLKTLRNALDSYRPVTELERIKCCAARAILAYHTFSLYSRAYMHHLQDIPFKREHFCSNRIDEVLLECQLEREAQLHTRMEAIRVHYTELLTVLAADGFRTLWVLPSIAQISSIMDNTARLLHLNYHPHRAVELQLVNLLLVMQRQAERPHDQCAALGFLLEHHRLTEVALQSFQTVDAGTFNTLEDLAERALRLLPPSDSTLDDVPDNRKFALLNLHLSLAVYCGARAKHEQALRVIKRALSHVQKSSGTEETIGPLLRGRTAQVIFRLATEYGLPWPESVTPFAFLKRMMESFNELQKIATDHTFALSLATLDMTMAVLQHLIVRYGTDPLVEPQVEQLLRFVLRRGASLRAIQLLLLYGQMCADMEKLERCELVISYLDRLLMLRPILCSQEKENRKITDELILSNGPKAGKAIIRSPMQTSHSADVDFVDDEREAAPKHKNLQAPPSGRPYLVADEEALPNATVEEYLMFQHSPNCDCRYCAYPQYKSLAFLTASLATRLSVLQDSTPSERIERSYQTLVEHWQTQMFPTFTTWAAPAYRTDLTVGVIQTLLQRGQFLVRQERYDAAREAYGWAMDLFELNVIDPALGEDVQFGMSALDMLVKRAANGLPKRQKQTRSTIDRRFREMIARHNKTSDDDSPQMASLSTKLANMNVKPRTVAPPKTVDRVNELLRQAASRRHQLKTTGDGLFCADAAVIPNRAYSASARKPQAVSIFVDSPPGRTVQKKPTVPATVGRNAKRTAKTADPMVIKDAGGSGGSGGDGGGGGGGGGDNTSKNGRQKSAELKSTVKQRRGKRDLISESPVPVTPIRKDATDSYKDTLMKGTPFCTPTSRPVTAGVAVTTGRKVRRLVVDEFPSLSGESDTDATTQITTPRVAQRKQTDSPVLNGSFRDVLVLGSSSKRGSTEDDGVVIVLDDSNEISHQSEEAIETSFNHSHAVSADGRNGLVLRTYSDRKRMLGSGGRPLSATKRWTPLSMSTAKTKLRFDDASPDHESKAADDDVMVVKGHEEKQKAQAEMSSARSRMKTVLAPPPVVGSVSVERVEPRVSCIASRTRLRRKRI
uniref:Separase n=1 Tax=Anopheles dirus TaxID=7168 RepID=A0A182N4B5_9DIPT